MNQSEIKEHIDCLIKAIKHYIDNHPVPLIKIRYYPKLKEYRVWSPIRCYDSWDTQTFIHKNIYPYIENMNDLQLLHYSKNLVIKETAK